MYKVPNSEWLIIIIIINVIQIFVFIVFETFIYIEKAAEITKPQEGNCQR